MLVVLGALRVNELKDQTIEAYDCCEHLSFKQVEQMTRNDALRLVACLPGGCWPRVLLPVTSRFWDSDG